MSHTNDGMTEKFGPEFNSEMDEQELFEAHVKYLKEFINEKDLMWITQFGRVGLQGFFIED